MAVNLIANARIERNKMDFKKAMCEFGIPTEKIIEYTNQMKLSEIIESIPPDIGRKENLQTINSLNKRIGI